MSLTLANIEADLLFARGLAPWLEEVGMAADVATGSNPDLRWPIREALRRASVNVADPTTPTDDDVAGLTGTAYDEFMDRAYLYALIHVRNNWNRARAKCPPPTPGPDGRMVPSAEYREAMERFADLTTMIDEARDDVNGRYGDDLGTAQFGAYDLGISRDGWRGGF